MITMILHHRTSLKIKRNSNGMEKKVVSCVNHRALYDFARQTIFRKIACFWNYTKEEVFIIIKIELSLVLFTVGYLDTILILETNEVLKGPLELGELMRWFGFWLYVDFGVGIPGRCDWWSVTPSVMHILSPFRLKK